jgi:hypothetical protein
MARFVRHVVVVGLLTLVCGALAASPAAANQRGDAVNSANDFIYGCTANGGDIAGVGSKEEFVVVVCLHENGSSQQCSWDASNDWERTCWWDHPELRSPDEDGRGVDTGDEIKQGQVVGRQGATLLADGEALTSADADGGAGDEGTHARGKGKNSGKHDKSKAKGNGKKHGESKGHHKGGRRK